MSHNENALFAVFLVSVVGLLGLVAVLVASDPSDAQECATLCAPRGVQHFTERAGSRDPARCECREVSP